MRFDRLTTKSQEALSAAQKAAERAGHPEVGTEHLLQALLEQKDGAVLPILEAARVPVDRIQKLVEERLRALPKVSGRRQTVLSPTIGEL
ncbi:MAG TPA: Clp protease N-terminal domain-containing protein, partial [Candidatus Eisenbacteria bacterium]|nr:Clp protease N-terminal domain-containing protein [Candidatus Eisenbacteria bacterium]